MSGRDTSVTFRISALSVLVAAVAALVLAGCTTSNPGLPTPTSGSDPGSSSPATSQAVSDDWWHDTNACNLLDQATATGLGYPQAGQVQGGQSYNCRWTASDGSVIGILLESQSYDSLQANMGQLSDLTIAGRPAKQDLQAGGDPHSCDITVQATAGSDAFIDVSTLNTTAAQACQIARTVATAIAPKLPGASK
jgi:outer membrane PBP1 activator LpoA protein